MNNFGTLLTKLWHSGQKGNESREKLDFFSFIIYNANNKVIHKNGVSV